MPDVIIYKWELASVEEVQRSKKYLMEVALSHENEGIRSDAYSTLGRAFKEQEDVISWLLEQQFKSIPEGEDADLRALILASIIMVTGDQFELERTIAIKSLLGHPILRQRYNALKVMVMFEMTEPEFLPDVIACFTTSSESYKLNSMMVQLLNQYDLAELVSSQMAATYTQSGWSTSGQTRVITPFKSKLETRNGSI